jgi:methionine-rich copper-binding protein CopC
VLAALLALGGVLGSATAASAHDKLQSTSPEQGSAVPTPPAAITLTFNQPVFEIGARVRVAGPGGDVAQGQPVFENRVVRQPLRPDAPAGTYTVDWQVTSSDGHPIAGTWRFSVANAAATTAPAAATTATATAAPTEAEPPSATATAVSPAASEDSGGSTGVVVAVTAAAAVVLLVVAAAVAWTSRRRRA